MAFVVKDIPNVFWINIDLETQIEYIHAKVDDIFLLYLFDRDRILKAKWRDRYISHIQIIPK